MRKSLICLLVNVSMIMGCSPVTPVIPSIETQVSLQTPVSPETSVPLTPTIVITDTLYPTSTLQPPLVEHEWSPEPVLVYSGSTFGMGPIYPRAPKFILYADGRLFVTSYDRDIKREQILTKRLERQGICQILNTIDQVGYLDYNPQDYMKDSPFRVADAGDSYINVNAWKSISGKYNALEDAFIFRFLSIKKSNGDLLRDSVIISSALANIYYFLEDFPNSDFQVYDPDKLLLWVSSRPDIQFDGTGKLWPFENPALAELHSQTGSGVYGPYHDNPFVVLNDGNAQTVFDLFDKSYAWDGEVMFDNKIAYQVFARPLMPYENPQLWLSDFSASDAPKPDFKLHCYPSDGTLPIPIPSYP